MSDFLEILKYILPALVVFGTVYFLFTKFINQQYRMKMLDFKQSENANLLPLRFQAYERLLLMLERMEPSSMFLRLNSAQINAGQMTDSMLITLNQEFDYNVTQQLYISDNLWKIICLAKEQTASLIMNCSEGVKPTEASSVFITRYNAIVSQLKASPLDTAKSALKNELQVYL